MIRVAVIFGTRPEAIKLAPVVLALGEHPGFECRVCVTAQHREMLDQVLDVFDIRPDADLDLMQPDQTLAELSARAITGLDRYLRDAPADIVLVQGDTTTVFCAALAAFYRGVTVGHVEAGLRTGNLHSPWPEEANRVLTSRLTALHFAPTETSRQNLLAEGVSDGSIHVTGNTVIDALLRTVSMIEKEPPVLPELPAGLLTSNERLVLITSHRRESFGPGLERSFGAIARLAERYRDVQFVYPVHRNPNVEEPAARLLGATATGADANVHLIAPLGYLQFVALMQRSTLVLTDSGGVQEEAPSLGKPVLVMRDTTERPEAVEAGTARLVGTDGDAIVAGVAELLESESAYEKMARAHNPYGDGQAAGRIVAAIEAKLGG